MPDENVLAGGIETLYIMKENLLELEGYKERSKELSKEEDRLEKVISAKEKAIADEIVEVTRRRKEEIENSFEEQISKIKARLKKVKSKKDKHKDSKVSERIGIETSELVEEKRQLLEETKSVFRLNHIPRIFNNRLYYALFLPQGIKDIFIILITLLICFLAIPVAVYQLLLPQKLIWIVTTYFVTVIVFGGLYFKINHITKEKHQEGYGKLRVIRKKLLANAKSIKVIERAIRKDKDESVYGLENYNNEIQQLDTEVVSITEEKKAALVTYETTTKYILAEEIQDRQKDEINELKKNFDQVYKEQRNAEDKVTQYSLDISRKYEAFVGKENMSIVRIERLIQLVESGEANKVSDAIAMNKQDSSTAEENV